MEAEKGVPSDDSPKQEKPSKQLDAQVPGPSNVNPEVLTTTSATKATSPFTLQDERKQETLPEGIETTDGSQQGTKIEEVGMFAMRLEFEETRSQYERLGEAMKERATLAMMDCLIQQQQKLKPQRRSDARGIGTQETPSKRSLLFINSSAVVRERYSLMPMSAQTLMSERSVNSCGPSTGKRKSSMSFAKLTELEKQVHQLEKQCRIMDRHLREHDRDQKNMEKKIHHLEMKILYDGQKQMIWDMMEKIPTEEDVKTIESFHSFALERKRTESQIKVLNVKVRALNTAMGKVNFNPLQPEKKFREASILEPSLIKQSSTGSLRGYTRLPDFSKMTQEEREEFFRQAGVTVYEYDRDEPDFEDAKQKKGKKLKLKKVNIEEPESSKRVRASRRKSPERDGNESTKSAKSKSTKSKSSSETSPVQSAESGQQISDSESTLANENYLTEEKETSPARSVTSPDSTDSEGSSSEAAPADEQNQANGGSTPESQP